MSDFKAARLDEKKEAVIKTMERLINQLDEQDPELVLVAYEKEGMPAEQL